VVLRSTQETPFQGLIKNSEDNHAYNKNMIIKEIQSKTILSVSKVYPYVINPYTGCQHNCLYCYAHFMKRFTGHQEPWGQFVDVKVNAPDLLRLEITGKKTGLPDIRFHDLRHTAATLMLQQGVHPKVVQERLGHSNIALTLNTYSHVLPSMQDAAAEKMDEFLVNIINT
jgi:hypothetical protein